ncbi:putative integrase p49 (IN) [Phytophthora infestans]|uniref:Putative integrase p49 (IN) n=1 Tax=Phytophthora infestans TaxID=4787 RepID=A0A833T1V9_PHYIN|nr:putative integrase p49 (IN) [Phytophthora infestans]
MYIYFITGLPSTNSGNDTILVKVDRHTKRAQFIPIVSKNTAQQLAAFFVKQSAKEHGLLLVCATIFGTKLKMASAHVQRTEGQVERINKILASYLRHYVSRFRNDWDNQIALAEFAYSRQYQSTIQMSPFRVDLGFEPRFPIDSHLTDVSDLSNRFSSRSKTKFARAASKGAFGC